MKLPSSTSQNTGISIIRMLATVFIVICHIFQAYDNLLAFYFNIGVPLFFGISGYLYGRAEKKDVLSFYRSRFYKVIAPYYLYVFLLMIVYFITNVPFTLKQVVSMLICQQAFGTTLPNCGHLWFITIIVACYILTPILLDLRDSLQVNIFSFTVFFGSLSVLVLLVSILDGFPMYVTYVAVYILGFYISARKNQPYNLIAGGVLLGLLILGFLGFIYLFLLQSKGFHIPGIVLHLYKIVFSIIIIENLSTWSWSYWNLFELIQPLLAFFNRYSYAIYLCHHIWILGVLSVVYISQNLFLNTALAVLLVLFTAIFFQSLFEVCKKKWLAL